MSKLLGNIFLVWRKGIGHRRIAVGEIRSNSLEGVRFRYLNENLEEAKKQGFTPYTGFPDFNKEYTENVLGILSQRLIKIERNDASDFYKFWKVDENKKQDSYYMLAQTQGLLPIDNFEFLGDFNPIEGLKFVSEVAGLSFSKPPLDLLRVGDSLSYELDPTNSSDSRAVKLFKNSIQVGYVKLIHSRVFYKTKREIKITVHHIEKNGSIKRVFLLLSLS
ncbi:MAG: hypothetical protein ABJN36_18215 [Cyclobacteriaceae bacterium]